jgi:exopolysaccharide biosynthesis polyprenyl glycosylphosphotransferase
MEADLRPIRNEEVAQDSQPAAGGESESLRVVESVGDLTVVRDAGFGPADVIRPAIAGSNVPRPRNAQQSLFAVSLMLAGSDILCLAAALFMSDWLIDATRSVHIPLGMVLVASVLWVAVFYGFRLYSTHHLSAPEEFRRVISATSIGVLVLVVVTLGTYSALGRTWLGLTWFLALVFELGCRRFWRAVLYQWRKGADLALRTLVVGTGPEARRLAAALAAENLGFLPVGHVSLNGSARTFKGGRLLDAFVKIIRTENADCVLVASTEVDHAQMMVIRRAARVCGVDLRVSANVPETLSTRLSLQQLGDIMTIALRPVRLTGVQAVTKRTFDLLVSSVGLVLSLPVMGLIALAVKLTSPGPVFFKQERVTTGGRAFAMYKFRTMVQDADRLLDEAESDTSEAFFKLREAPPLTKVGRVLRRLSLDEIPQLWNVLKGEMSIVGPRPLPVEQVAANLDLLEYRHEVRAGLTGWWQINGRSDVDAEAAVRMDLFYIENWSVALDLYILLKTAGALLQRRGAY